ncbi:glutamate receptor 3-like [Culicoides brevitarsis]|uniref:glutamate receptor 3-like n=1 Tax=Culicoides brevitarsis TaxID=469753 RepID=UPI00307C27F3
MGRLRSILILSLAFFAVFETSHAKKHYKVASHLISAFLEEDTDHPSGYKGFVVDFLDELVKHLHFTYEFVFADDNLYGSLNPKTHKWTGMMGVLTSGNADMIVADLTETVKRRQATDFTSPFLVTGIGILYHQVTRQALPFNNLDELVNQSEVKYGVVNHGSTYEFIKKSRNETFERMAAYFAANPDVLVPTVMAGVDRVMESEGKYAFIGEAVAYHVLKKHKYPELLLVGDTFWPRQFGVVFPKGSRDRDTFDSVIFELRENGVLDSLAKKWNLS